MEAYCYRDPQYWRFQALLFVPLTGYWGLAAVIGAIQPPLVMMLAWCVDRQRSPWVAVLSAVTGIIGMALLLLSPHTVLDPGDHGGVCRRGQHGAGDLAVSPLGDFATGGGADRLAIADWRRGTGSRCMAGGSAATGVTLTQAVGYLWLCVAGAMLAYGLWFRGISRLHRSLSQHSAC